MTSLILASIISMATPAQEWVRTDQGKVAWARPAPSLVPADAPILLKSAPLGQILSKLWLAGGETFASIGPGGPLIELARILNSQPGLKAINMDRPIYAAFYHPSALEHVRTSTNTNVLSQILKHAVIVLPVTSEKRFYRSLDSRFEKITSGDALIQSYRLQADRLDYEAWVKATLEGQINPQDVPSEGFARQGDDRLYCRGNGMYVAMTSNQSIAKELAKVSLRQEWTMIPTSAPKKSTMTDPMVATHVTEEYFLDPTADITINFRLEGKGAVKRQFFQDRIKTLVKRLDGPKSSADGGDQPVSMARAFTGSLANLLGTDFDELKSIEASLHVHRGRFDLGLRAQQQTATSWQVKEVEAETRARQETIRRIPIDAAAGGWIDVGYGPRLRQIYIDLIAPLTGITWQQQVAMSESTSPKSWTPTRSAYYLDLDAKLGFSFVEIIDLEGRLPKSPAAALKRFSMDSLLGRTISRTSSSDQQLVFQDLRTIDNNETLFFRFGRSPRRFIWETSTNMESTVSRLMAHPAPVAVTAFQGYMICVCAEHPDETIQSALKKLRSAPIRTADAKPFNNPNDIEHWGYLKPRALQDMLFGPPNDALHSEGEAVQFIVGHDRAVRRFHVRGPLKFFGEFQTMLTVARAQRQKLQTRQRMMLIRRAWKRRFSQLKTTSVPTLVQLFEANGDRPAVLPPFYRFVLDDGWGRPFKLEQNANKKFVLRSHGADGQLGGEDNAADFILVLP